MKIFLASILLSMAFVGCAVDDAAVDVDPTEESAIDAKADGGTRIPDVACNGTPDANLPRVEFRHDSSRFISLAKPHHRGLDLIAAASTRTQVLRGWISYGKVDKSLPDEKVEIFACRAGAWKLIGNTITGDDGFFELKLTGAKRLPVGMRDMYVSVAGDRSGTRFLAYVAPDGTNLMISDVDGTLTSSENAFVETVVLGTEPSARAGAAHAYEAAKAKGYQFVYVTARGNQYTTETRDWLSHQGFPRGPVRLSESFVTLPGADTVNYKTSTFKNIDTNLTIAAGVGNRASDIEAYSNIGLTAAQIFIETPEYESEVAPKISAGLATGFATYDELRTKYLSKL